MSAQTIFSRTLSPITPPNTPFQIKEWTGLGSGYMVTDGYCFSTFSYDTGSYIPIEKLNTRFDFKENEKFYIDFSITPNLQIEKAEIKCSKTGPQANAEDKSDPKEWGSYPSMFYIQPQDQLDENGRVKVLAEGKRQLKCYVLIGYRKDDATKNGPNSLPVQSNYLNSNEPVQILKENIILMASMYSGVPVVFPMPYLNAFDHVLANKSQPII